MMKRVSVLVASLRAVKSREAELDQLQQMRPNRQRRRQAAQESEVS